MSCKCSNNEIVDVVGLCNPDNISEIFGQNPDPKLLSWTEISIPEVLVIPPQKPDIETIDKVLIDVKIISKRVVKTPGSDFVACTPIPTPLPDDENEEGTKLTGRKLIVEGILNQKIVYTADVPQQNVHSAHFNVPFSAFIVIPQCIDGVDSLDITFCVQKCVEDVFVKAFNKREIFKNVTLFLRALPLEDGCV